MTIMYRFGESFPFTAQILNYTFGCIGSCYCASCEGETSCFEHVCRHCHLPFVGPKGLPEFSIWMHLTLCEKKRHAIKAYRNIYNHGRYVHERVASFPLNEVELVEVEKIQGVRADMYRLTHGILPQDIRIFLKKHLE